MIATDDYFLSTTNPIATAAQRDLEAQAIRILESDEVVRARELVTMRWKTLAGGAAPEEAWRRFDELIEEFVFGYALKAAVGNPDHPEVLGHHYCPPHEWFGRRVPGSRASGGDGPDQHYVLIPVTHGARYEIEGRRLQPEPADIPLIVQGNPSLTMTNCALDLRTIDIAEDGRYTLTVGPEPPGSKPNHVHVPPGSMYIFIRECRNDWRQVPSTLRVRRLDPPLADPWTDEQVAARAARMMVEDVAPMYWFLGVYANLEPNTVPPIFNTGGIGGLISQSIMLSRLQLDADEAFVFTVGAGDSPYRNIVLHDYWFRTIDYWTRATSRTVAQSRANPDGTYTYVVAHEDPGIANWLDASGFSHLKVVARWQGFPAEPRPNGPPSASGGLVKASELESVLPAGIPRTSAAERGVELSQRRAEFLLRFAV